jgi:light-regulated signal transduction histidine kinase (bacteriophytochrome)
MQERLEIRKLPESASLAGSPDDLLRLVDADLALLNIDDKIRAIGNMEPYRELLAIMAYLQACRFTEIRLSQNIKLDFPGFSYPPGLSSIAGFLLIPLSAGDGSDFLVFFRKTQTKHIEWAGYGNIFANINVIWEYLLITKCF